jgi:hypothetical protein
MAAGMEGSEQGGGNSWEHDFRWLVAWLVLILVIAAIGRTRVGQVAIYYGLCLCLLFLIVTQFRFFADALAPFRNLGPGLTNAEQPQGG